MTLRETDLTAIHGVALLGGDGGRVVDHVTLASRSILLASLLSALDLRRGDVVALLADTSPSVYELLVGVRRAGAVLMVIDPALSLEQNAFAINTSRALVMVTDTAHASTAQSLIALTPYVRARFGLDGELPGHRSLPLARSAAPVRTGDAAPSGTLHHAIGPSGRPVELRLPDPVTDELGRAQCRELLGRAVLDASTVLVDSAPLLSPLAAQLGAAALAAGGGVALPRDPTGIELLRTAFAVEGTVLHLTAAAAAEIAALSPDRVMRLTPLNLVHVVVDGNGCPSHVHRSLVRMWGERVRLVRPAYLEALEPTASEFVRSVTQAEI